MYTVEEYSVNGWQVVKRCKYMGDAYDSCLKLSLLWGKACVRLICPNGRIIKWEKKNAK